MSIYIHTYLPIYLSTYLPIYLSTYLPINMSKLSMSIICIFVDMARAACVACLARNTHTVHAARGMESLTYVRLQLLIRAV